VLKVRESEREKSRKRDNVLGRKRKTERKRERVRML
jgi:hypothetical protein